MNVAQGALDRMRGGEDGADLVRRLILVGTAPRGGEGKERRLAAVSQRSCDAFDYSASCPRCALWALGVLNGLRGVADHVQRSCCFRNSLVRPFANIAAAAL